MFDGFADGKLKMKEYVILISQLYIKFAFQSVICDAEST